MIAISQLLHVLQAAEAAVPQPAGPVENPAPGGIAKFFSAILKQAREALGEQVVLPDSSAVTQTETGTGAQASEEVEDGEGLAPKPEGLPIEHAVSVLEALDKFEMLPIEHAASVLEALKQSAEAALPGEFNIGITAFPGDSIPTSPFEFNIDFLSVTSLSGLSEVTNPTQDGFPLGVLEDFNIGENGIINGVFSNGLTRVLGQVALATFSNVAGLERVGNNMFRVSSSSGIPQIGQSNTGGRGSISGGVLEGSNVDLGTEFSNMIVTQRGFQANARTITIADTLLGEAVNLVR
ncbi:MAG: flagellar hook-basal body complex protein [Candidatus Hydrogenedentes bacterium]|nr:flagellar hook-basal body complex protein [Candidatus Hydrogenedentota bacterium]